MIQNGMIVTYANRNIHSNGDKTAYGGITGVVSNLSDDNSFVINAENCILVVPMRNAWKQRLKGVWLTIEGKDVWIKSKESAWEKKERIENSLLNKIANYLKHFLPLSV
jgi:hypothetical protein